MEENDFGSVEDLFESIEAGLRENFGGQSSESPKKAKKESLKDMQKELPEWSLEPPETFLA